MLIQRFLPRPTPLITLSFSKQKSMPFFLHPIHGTSVLNTIPNLNPFFTSLSTRPFQFSSSLRSFSTTSSQSILESPKNDVFSEIDAVGVEIEEELNDFSVGLERVLESETSGGELKGEKLLPNLSVKEKKELASYAHSLGKKLKSQQVGKSGVTDFVITALIETLEANELLKLKIHNNCPGELEDAVKQLEVGTGSVVVSKIGRTVILYRPSLSKMKAREKKQAQRIPMRKQPAPQQIQSKTEVPRQFGRGRRGSSRLGG